MAGFVFVYLLVGSLYALDTFIDLQDPEQWDYFEREVAPIFLLPPHVGACLLTAGELVMWPMAFLAGSVPFCKTRFW